MMTLLQRVEQSARLIMLLLHESDKKEMHRDEMQVLYEDAICKYGSVEKALKAKLQ